MAGGFDTGFNSFLEGAAAIFVIYWLLASLSSFIVEMFSSILNIRGNALRLFAIDMVQGELDQRSAQNAEIPRAGLGRFPHKGVGSFWSGKVDLSHKSVSKFSRRLFEHPLMRALEQPKVDRGRANTAPAYVPSTVFAKAVLDLLRNAGSVNGMVTEQMIAELVTAAERTDARLAGVLSSIVKPLVEQLGKVTFTATMNGHEAVVAALTAVFDTAEGAKIYDKLAAIGQIVPTADTAAQKARNVAGKWLGGAAGPLALIQAPLPATVAGVTTALHHADVPDALRRALRPLMDAANHDMDRLTNEIAVWYDASMQRATGWYKRYSMLVLGIIGLLFAVSFNVDTPRVIGALIESPALRQSGYAAAVQVVGASSESEQEKARRQAMPQQFAFATEFDDLCGTSSPLDTSGSTAIKCANYTNILKEYKESDREKASQQWLRREHMRLLPLSLQSSGSGQIIALIAMRAAGGTDAAFVQQLQAYCEGDNACGTALSQSIADYNVKYRAAADAAARKALDLAPVAEALVNDTKLFWYPGIAQAALAKPEKGKPRWDINTLTGARIAAEASTGALSAYVQGIPGVGPIVTVSKKEGWSFWSSDTPLRLIGWVLTAMMVSLGAPFWFDLLQQIVNRRSTGPKPDEAAQTPVG